LPHIRTIILHGGCARSSAALEAREELLKLQAPLAAVKPGVGNACGNAPLCRPAPNCLSLASLMKTVRFESAVRGMDQRLRRPPEPQRAYRRAMTLHGKATPELWNPIEPPKGGINV